MYAKLVLPELVKQKCSSIETRNIDLPQSFHNVTDNDSKLGVMFGDLFNDVVLRKSTTADCNKSLTSEFSSEENIQEKVNLRANTLTTKCKSKKPRLEGPDLYSADVIKEIKLNYENEISVLKRQLQPVGVESIYSEDSLLRRCYTLEVQLQRAQNERELMYDQVQGLRTQLRSWPARICQLEDENQTLRVKVDDDRSISLQKQNEIDCLHGIVKTLQAKLWNQSMTKNRQEKTFAEKLLVEYDQLLEKYDSMKITNMEWERKICEAKLLIYDLSAEMKEIKFELLQLERENSLLKKCMIGENFKTRNPIRAQTDYRECITSNNGRINESTTRSTILNENKTMQCYPCRSVRNSKGNAYDSKSIKEVRFKCEDTYQGDDRNYEDNLNIQFLKNIKNEAGKSLLKIPKNQSEEGSIDNDKEETDWFSHFNDGGYHSSVHDIVLRYGEHHNDRLHNNGLMTDGNLQRVTEEEDKLVRLLKEKKQLLINLSHIPITSTARNKKINREKRESFETKLDHIDRELGLIRMTLKRTILRK